MEREFDLMLGTMDYGPFSHLAQGNGPYRHSDLFSNVVNCKRLLSVPRLVDWMATELNWSPMFVCEL